VFWDKEGREGRKAEELEGSVRRLDISEQATEATAER